MMNNLQRQAELSKQPHQHVLRLGCQEVPHRHNIDSQQLSVTHTAAGNNHTLPPQRKGTKLKLWNFHDPVDGKRKMLQCVVYTNNVYTHRSLQKWNMLRCQQLLEHHKGLISIQKSEGWTHFSRVRQQVEDAYCPKTLFSWTFTHCGTFQTSRSRNYVAITKAAVSQDQRHLCLPEWWTASLLPWFSPQIQLDQYIYFSSRMPSGGRLRPPTHKHWAGAKINEGDGGQRPRLRQKKNDGARVGCYWPSPAPLSSNRIMAPPGSVLVGGGRGRRRRRRIITWGPLTYFYQLLGRLLSKHF